VERQICLGWYFSVYTTRRDEKVYIHKRKKNPYGSSSTLTFTEDVHGVTNFIKTWSTYLTSQNVCAIRTSNGRVDTSAKSDETLRRSISRRTANTLKTFLREQTISIYDKCNCDFSCIMHALAEYFIYCSTLTFFTSAPSGQSVGCSCRHVVLSHNA
jgi:hypothetical protein